MGKKTGRIVNLRGLINKVIYLSNNLYNTYLITYIILFYLKLIIKNYKKYANIFSFIIHSPVKKTGHQIVTQFF